MMKGAVNTPLPLDGKFHMAPGLGRASSGHALRLRRLLDHLMHRAREHVCPTGCEALASLALRFDGARLLLCNLRGAGRVIANTGPLS